jgi:hypothetical protein
MRGRQTWAWTRSAAAQPGWRCAPRPRDMPDMPDIRLDPEIEAPMAIRQRLPSGLLPLPSLEEGV